MIKSVHNTSKSEIKKAVSQYKKGLQRYLLVSLTGVEPAAFPLGGGRSIQLSYRDIYKISTNIRSFFPKGSFSTSP